MGADRLIRRAVRANPLSGLSPAPLSELHYVLVAPLITKSWFDAR